MFSSYILSPSEYKHVLGLPPPAAGPGVMDHGHASAARSSGRPPGLDGLRFFDDTATWFEKEWMPLVRIGPLQQATEPSHDST